jgi:hypothetical protein
MRPFTVISSRLMPIAGWEKSRRFVETRLAPKGRPRTEPFPARGLDLKGRSADGLAASSPDKRAREGEFLDEPLSWACFAPHGRSYPQAQPAAPHKSKLYHF